MKHLFIINPVAGGKRSRLAETEHKIRDFADRHGVPYEIYLTKAPMDACQKVARETEINDKLYVYACGGDGTLNECVNGAALCANTAVTQYPCGTGNDFIKTFGSADIHKFRDLQALADGSVRPIDLIDCNGRYGINICSVGIDARVGADVHKYSGIPIVGGAAGYVVSLVVNVIKGVSQNFRLSTGGEMAEKRLTLVCACNGRFYGGGFNPVPDAMPDDGIIEYLIVEDVSRLKVAKVVGRYSKGRFRELGNIVTHIRGGYVEIGADREFIVNIDGEIIHTENVCFKAVPKGVNFLFPLGMDFFVYN